jgi:hypothetical protein
MKLTSTTVCSLAASLLLASASAQTVNWTSDRTLRVEFRMPSSAWPLQPNSLSIAGGYVNIVRPLNRMTATLYNRGVVMGTAQSTLGAGYTGQYSFWPFGTGFRTAASPYRPSYGEAAVLDFTSIWDRSIDGRIDFNIDSGSIQMNLGSVAMMLWEASGPNYGQSIYPSPIITSVKLIPESPTDPPPPPPVVPGPPVFGGDDDVVLSVGTLKYYCEQTKGSAIVFRTNVTIFGNGSTPVSIGSGCTIDLAPNVNFMLENASLAFNGPLSIQSRGRAGLKLSKAMVSSPSINIEFRGSASEILGVESTLRAANASLSVVLADSAKLEWSKGFGNQAEALFSGDRLTLAAGAKFTGALLGASARGNNGIVMDLKGDEPVLKVVDGTTLNAPAGSVEIYASGSKALLEVVDGQVRFGRGLTVDLAGTESMISLSKTTLGPTSGLVQSGLTLLAGSTGGRGQINGSEVTISRVRTATVRASSGLLNWTKGSANLQGDIIFEAGSITEVVESNLRSGTRIRVFAPSTGTCNASASSLSAPTVQLCPAF